MQERDVLDLFLVAVLAVLTYVEAFGLADPIATVDEILAIFAGIGVEVYLVLGGLFGIVFVGYLTVYLPKKDASQPVRR
ncbi:hypothetical protein OB920_09155 [Halobacteria archaeon HArc-gm2]|nr:hypothetical protein [Halobacteria archaeon HArc-gm2]